MLEMVLGNIECNRSVFNTGLDALRDLVNSFPMKFPQCQNLGRYGEVLRR